ncbi:MULTISPECIES: heme ABC transporter permease [unclassified Devosia]|uniref:heme ABC transporter permease n=1 Tax=unclassified Devosia TaxID=196773 RepID=UPI00145E8FF9|nr:MULTISPECIES: heme ABC transporter permease [unclassified Devosia]MBJ6988500.1 heme ABC transporter permease [Devosia sp. MC521]MBK1795592.1 heme ABC transporter permease [Devosia sp. WQ 349K1]QMW62543.1 heme ABC transporter permease [Devosia sp. MC521]
MSTDNTPKMSWWNRIAHPGFFIQWTRPLIWPLVIITAVLFVLGVYYSFFVSPPEKYMGDTVRIMYVHVPTAWLSQFVYAAMTVSALGTLIWRHPMADVSMKAAAPMGALFTALALFTGSMWGRPTWGTFWEWDGRMTSTLIMLFIYLGLIALWRAFDDQLRAGRIVAIFTLVGAVNIPIIKFSVDWWSTLHQPASVFTAEGPKMPAEILTPLFLMMFAFTFMFGVLQLISMHTEVRRRRVATLERKLARGGAA